MHRLSLLRSRFNSFSPKCWRILAARATLLLLSACFLGEGALAAPQIYLTQGSAKPGEVGYIEARLRSDGFSGYVIGSVHIGAGYFRTLNEGPAVESSPNAICSVDGSAYGVRFEIFVPHAEPDSDTLICKIPVIPTYEVRRTVGISVGGRCLDLGEVPVFCEAIDGVFFIDGRDPLSERRIAIVPRPSPLGPTQAEVLAFDYSDGSRTAPLAALEFPRPESVARTLFGPHPSIAGTPNSAVQDLLRAVDVTYVDRVTRDVGLAAAARDVAVQATIPDPISDRPRVLVHPSNPEPLQPLALWLTHRYCDFFAPRTYDDREVRIEAGNIVVLVAFDTDQGCFGGYGAGVLHTEVLNLPGLSPGTYTLEVRRKSLLTGLEVLRPGEPALLATVTVSGTPSAANAPQAIPTLRWFAATLLMFGIVAASRVRY